MTEAVSIDRRAEGLSTPFGRISLFAVVPASDVRDLRLRIRGLRVVTSGTLAALVGDPLRGQEDRAALQHDRIVGRALMACSSTVPFRFGVDVSSEDELHRVLEINYQSLQRNLARFAGLVEMGLKARLASQSNPARLSRRLEPIRTLATNAEDRRERIQPGEIFEGCYLIERKAIETFWSTLEELRRCHRDLLLLGSGPWAPYSFSDFALGSQVHPVLPVR